MSRSKIGFRSLTRRAEDGGDYSRRSSYYNPYAGHNRQYSDRGYPANRQNYSRPTSYVDNANGYYSGGGPSESYSPYNQNGGRRARQHARGYSEQPSYYSQQSGYQNGYAQNGYAQNGYYKSSDNVTMASPSSGSATDQWANSTDPSSINSSLDQFQQQQQQQQQQQEQAIAESYGFQGFSAGPNINGQAFVPEKAPQGQEPGPVPPAHDPNAGGPVGGNSGSPLAAGRRHLQRKSLNQSVSSDAGDNGTKRKSWFKRTFSKS